MNHKRFVQIFDSILLIAFLVFSILAFRTSFEKSFDKMMIEPVGESKLENTEENLDSN